MCAAEEGEALLNPCLHAAGGAAQASESNQNDCDGAFCRGCYRQYLRSRVEVSTQASLLLLHC